MTKERVMSLDEIKEVELNILKYLHELCEKHDIKYFIDFGIFIEKFWVYLFLY